MAVDGVRRVDRIQLNSADPQALARFFVDALGFIRGPDMSGLATAIALTLGGSRLDLKKANGSHYPGNVPGWSPVFQHFAVITGNMSLALGRLREVPGWRSISRDGPQHLPDRSGGAVAFKFHDPEGHPLELISFPRMNVSSPEKAFESSSLCVGIDHTAISVTNIARSIGFYSGLGLTAGVHSFNFGPEQDRLDGVADAHVDVVELNLPDSGPHLELLHYRGEHNRTATPFGTCDIAATRTVLVVRDPKTLFAIRDAYSSALVESTGAVMLLRDPDGHLVEIKSETSPGAQ